MFLGHILHYADGYISPVRFPSLILNTDGGYSCRFRPPTHTLLALGLGEPVCGAVAAARDWDSWKAPPGCRCVSILFRSPTAA